MCCRGFATTAGRERTYGRQPCLHVTADGLLVHVPRLERATVLVIRLETPCPSHHPFLRAHVVHSCFFVMIVSLCTHSKLSGVSALLFLVKIIS